MIETSFYSVPYKSIADQIMSVITDLSTGFPDGREVRWRGGTRDSKRMRRLRLVGPVGPTDLRSRILRIFGSTDKGWTRDRACSGGILRIGVRGRRGAQGHKSMQINQYQLVNEYLLCSRQHLNRFDPVMKGNSKSRFSSAVPRRARRVFGRAGPRHSDGPTTRTRSDRTGSTRLQKAGDKLSQS